MISATDALRRLRDGNRRFVTDTHKPDATTCLHRPELVEGQAPMAIILGCSDSRVPAEIVFGQGLGDLFVIRVAGNIIAPSLVESVEFAAELFGTRLVVVLGHSQCGAVIATLQHLQEQGEHSAPHIPSIVDRIRPAIESLVDQDAGNDPDALLHRAVRANIVASANELRHGSQTLERLQRDGLLVVGAEYSLETGLVEFFDGVPTG